MLTSSINLAKVDTTALYLFLSLYLEEHGAILVRISWLDVVGCAGVSAARGGQCDRFPGHLLQTPCQAAASCAKLLRFFKARVLQDALGERSSQATLTGTAAQNLTWTNDTHTHTYIHTSLDDDAVSLAANK